MKNPLIACGLGLVALPLNLLAGTPSSGTLTPSTPKLTYTVGPFTVSNPTPVVQVDDGPRCNANRSPCDSYKLTVTLPAGSTLTKAIVTIAWPTSSNSDYDVYIYNGDQANLDGTVPADVGDSATSDNPEKVTFNLTAGTTAVYTIKVVPYTATPQEAVSGTIELAAGDTGGGTGTGGTSGASCAIPAGVRP